MFLCSSLACFASNLGSCNPANHAPDYLCHDHLDYEDGDDYDDYDDDDDGDDRRALMGWGTPMET